MRRMSNAVFPTLPKTEIFAHLAAGDARCTVVTPNRRLALALKREFDAAQANAGFTVWPSADILPFSAFLERAYREATDMELPLLLTPLQEQQLWETIVAASEVGATLLAPMATAAQCADAWQLAQAWRIDLNVNTGNQDTQAFTAWADAYAKRCNRDGYTDAARLPEVVIKLLKQNAVRKPNTLIAYAFDVLTPQQRDVLTAYQNAGTSIFRSAFLANEEPALDKQNVSRVICASPHEELERAARWARARLEQLQNADARRASQKTIAIVVPELDQRRAEVEHVFNQVMHPNAGIANDAMPARISSFNISLGLPLTEYPLVAHALAIFDIAQGVVEFEIASKLMRSPFIAGAEDEFAARARLDVTLRKKMPAQLSLLKLLGAIKRTETCPRLVEKLNALVAYVQVDMTGSASPQQWARHFSQLLEAIGFPGERALDSAEFQTHAKLNETFAEFARLERVVSKLSYAQARTWLRRLCNDTVFQPQQGSGSGTAPIQVLGIFEAAGMTFDYLWVSGLTDEALPQPARPHPFIAPALQKKAGIPQASSETSFARDQRIMHGWFVAAPEVIVSHAKKDGDRDLSPSPLIDGIAEATQMPAFDLYKTYETVIHAERPKEGLELIRDDVAPAFAGDIARGGARVLADQAACPFRAFAHHRLNAQALDVPQDGLDAMGRGNLVHALMEHLWQRLKTHAALAAMTVDEQDVLIDEAVAYAIAKIRRQPDVLEGRLVQLEAARLQKLAHDWLEIERARADFAVVVTEEKRDLEAGGLKLQGKIDRMDKLADGRYVLIDYKTGKQQPTANVWRGTRPDDPQLPLYAINAREDIAVVAFAYLRVGKLGFNGLSREDGLLPIKKPRHWDGDWEKTLHAWRHEIAALGQGFLAGDARVDPKNPPLTCKYCDLKPLCRVHEQMPALGDDDDNGGDGEEA